MDRLTSLFFSSTCPGENPSASRVIPPTINSSEWFSPPYINSSESKSPPYINSSDSCSPPYINSSESKVSQSSESKVSQSSESNVSKSSESESSQSSESKVSQSSESPSSVVSIRSQEVLTEDSNPITLATLSSCAGSSVSTLSDVEYARRYAYGKILDFLDNPSLYRCVSWSVSGTGSPSVEQLEPSARVARRYGHFRRDPETSGGVTYWVSTHLYSVTPFSKLKRGELRAYDYRISTAYPDMKVGEAVMYTLSNGNRVYMYDNSQYYNKTECERLRSQNR